MTPLRPTKATRSSLFAGLLLVALWLPESARAALPASSRPPGSAPEVRHRVERFFAAHPELAVAGPDLDRLVARLELVSAGRMEVGAEAKSSFERRRDAGRISDWRILDALSSLGLRAPKSGGPVSAAPAASAPSPEGGPVGTGRISGRVTEDGSGNGLPGIHVWILNQNGSVVRDVVTDGDGDYETPTNMPDGTFYARTKDGSTYIDELYGGVSCFPNCQHSQGTAIVLGVGEIETGIDFALALGGKIGGTVTGGTPAAPIQNAGIEVFQADGEHAWDAYADENGDYETLVALPAGIYRLRTTQHSGFLAELYSDIECQNGCAVANGDDVAVTAGATTDIDFELAVGGSIRGRVTDAESGDPLEGASVGVFDSYGSFLFNAFTDIDGFYETVADLSTGNYYLAVQGFLSYLDELNDGTHCGLDCVVTLGTPVSVTAGELETGIDFALDLGGTIAGTVTTGGGGSPLGGVLVTVFDDEGGFVNNVFTDGAGGYATSRGLPTGTYHLLAEGGSSYLSELYDDVLCAFSACDVTSGTGVSVTEGVAATGKNFDLGAGGSISGTVTDSATEEGIGGVDVLVYLGDGTFAAAGYTAGDGTYVTVGALPTGSYKVVTSNYGLYVDELHSNLPCLHSCDVALGAGVSVTAGAETAGIDFALDPGGSISGQITDTVTDAPLQVVARVHDSTGRLVDEAYTDFEGNWRSNEGLITGSYYVTTFNRIGYLDELHANLPCAVGCDAETGTAVVVTLGAESPGIDFALAKGGAIAGTLTDATTAQGLEEDEIDIRIFDANGTFVDSVRNYDDDGHYKSARGLPSGNYFLTAAASHSGSKYRGALYPGLDCPFGQCPPLAGTPVAVTVPALTSGIDFAMEHRALQADGFESSGFGGWNAKAGSASLMCAHPICVPGPSLAPSCDPCVALVIAEDPECASGWDWSCVEETYLVCGVRSCEWLPLQN